MKKRSKQIILGALGLLALLTLSVVLYFYIALSGNPIEGFLEQRQIIRFYEQKYNEDFNLLRSDYDYKRKEFTFSVASENQPEITFSTTLDETTRIDAYAAARCREYLYKVISDALGSDYDHLMYRVNVYEDYNSPGSLEPDLTKRLSQNQYTMDFSWDVTRLEPLQVDSVLKEMAWRISQRLEFSIGALRIRAGVYDGKDYYHADIKLR